LLAVVEGSRRRVCDYKEGINEQEKEERKLSVK